MTVPPAPANPIRSAKPVIPTTTFSADWARIQTAA
jgi:hypothetical protein